MIADNLSTNFSTGGDAARHVDEEDCDSFIFPANDPLIKPTGSGGTELEPDFFKVDIYV